MDRLRRSLRCLSSALSAPACLVLRVASDCRVFSSLRVWHPWGVQRLLAAFTCFYVWFCVSARGPLARPVLASHWLFCSNVFPGPAGAGVVFADLSLDRCAAACSPPTRVCVHSAAATRSGTAEADPPALPPPPRTGGRGAASSTLDAGAPLQRRSSSGAHGGVAAGAAAPSTPRPRRRSDVGGIAPPPAAPPPAPLLPSPARSSAATASGVTVPAFAPSISFICALDGSASHAPFRVISFCLFPFVHRVIPLV